MRIGVPTELKADENRVGLTPAGACELSAQGHAIMVESGAGEGSACADELYRAAGATICSVDQVWDEAELVLKVKEPLAAEYGRLRPDLVLFTYLHLAADRELTEALVASGATCIAYETVQLDGGQLPLLAPMSEVAGRLAAQMGRLGARKTPGRPRCASRRDPGRGARTRRRHRRRHRREQTLRSSHLVCMLMCSCSSAPSLGCATSSSCSMGG